MPVGSESSSADPLPLTFRKRSRLSLAGEFQGVYAAKIRKSRGPVTVFSLPNGLGRCRLGLSVGRRVGGAVVRNRVKRLIRESFRVLQHELPPGYDLVVSARAGGDMKLAEMKRVLQSCAMELHREWSRREARAGEGRN